MYGVAMFLADFFNLNICVSFKEGLIALHNATYKYVEWIILSREYLEHV